MRFEAPEVEAQVDDLYAQPAAWNSPVLITSLWLVRDDTKRQHMLRSLLQYDPSLAAYNKPLKLAIRHGDVECLRILLQHEAQVKVTGKLVGVALPDAAMVDLLLRHVGTRPGAMSDMHAPLEKAMAKHYTLCAKLLRAQGALTADEQEAKDAELNALARGESDAELTPQEAKLMLGSLPDSHAYVIPLLLESITAVRDMNDRETVLAMLIEAGAHPDNALVAAASGGVLRTMAMLLAHGVDVNGTGATRAMHAAIEHGRSESVHLLLDRGMMPAPRLLAEMLELAAFYWDPETSLPIFDALLQAGADPARALSLADAKGMRDCLAALHAAIGHDKEWSPYRHGWSGAVARVQSKRGRSK
jgi:ankyrin repeat protein